MSVGGAPRALVLFCNAVWNPALSWLKILVARSVLPLPSPPWLGDLPSAVTDQKSVTLSLHLPSRHRQSSMFGQRQPKKTVWIRWCRRWAQSTVTSPTDGVWWTVCGEDDAFACWEPNSCSCWQSPNLPFYVCTLVTLKSAHVALGRLKQKFSWTV